MPVQKTLASGKLAFFPTTDEIEEMDTMYLGLCVSCGMTQGGCETDAQGYKCNSCGANKVHGPLTYVMAGRVFEPAN